MSESFENVHMVIFCVMMVFILQASLMMRVATDLPSCWAEWEFLSPTGASASLEKELVRAKYIKADGTKGKDFTAGDFERRYWNVFGLKQVFDLVRKKWLVLRPFF